VVRDAGGRHAFPLSTLWSGGQGVRLELATAAARAAGYKGEISPLPLAEARKTLGDFADALALNQHVDSGKAVRLLGWQPRHGGFLDEVEVFYRAWKARQG